MAAGTVDLLLDPTRHVIKISEIGNSTDLELEKHVHPGSFVESYDSRPNGLRHGHRVHTDGTHSLIPLDSHIEDTIYTRWQEVITWAKREYLKATVHQLTLYDGTRDGRTRLRRSANLCKAFIYSLLLVAQTESNRSDNGKWAHIKSSMKSWMEIVKLIEDDNAIALLANIEDIYAGNLVLIWNESTPRKILKVRSSNDTILLDSEASALSDIPDFGLNTNHYEVREALELGQPYVTHVATLRSLSMETTGNQTIRINPEFMSDVLSYTALVPRGIGGVIVNAVPTHSQATIEIDGDTSVSESPTILSIIVTSEDRLQTVTYTISIRIQGG